MKQSKYLVPVVLSGISVMAFSHDGKKEEIASSPNIIVILTDDMGYGDIGVYGGNFVPTPSIDKMATEGIQLMQYYSASPISSPSRAGLITGMCPGRWNITTYMQSKEGHKAAEMAEYLDTQAPTLPRTLKNAGYATGHFGKWHLGGGRDILDAPPFKDYGYDEFSSTYESPQPDPLLTATNWIWSPEDSIKRWNRTAYFVYKTLDFLQRHKGQPCFVNLWPDDVHTPWIGNAEEQNLFPEGTESEKNFKTVLSEYDRQIGRLLQGLKDMGIDKNTIVIFTSDNGPAPSFRGSRSGNLRGCKASLFEGGTRMPFIVWSPDHLIPKGKVDKTSVVCAMDLFESLCKIAGVSLPSSYESDGTDRSNVLHGKPQDRNKPIFWEYARNDSKAFPRPKEKNDVSPNIAVRKGNWKLLINDDGSDVMLFDLAKDPKETTVLNDKYPQVVLELTTMALDWRKSLPQLKQSEH